MTASQASAVEQESARATPANLTCEWIDVDQKCPDANIRFYLYTRSNIDSEQLIAIDDSRDSSNLSASNFNINHETKVIVHGFRADMFMEPLYKMKDGGCSGDGEKVTICDTFGLSWNVNICYVRVEN